MENKTKCSFCGRPESEVDFLIPSPDGKSYICPICIDLCGQIIDEYDEEIDAYTNEPASKSKYDDFDDFDIPPVDDDDFLDDDEEDEDDDEGDEDF